jgi:RNA polymerase sigma factor (sigma-70 family)
MGAIPIRSSRRPRGTQSRAARRRSSRAAAAHGRWPAPLVSFAARPEPPASRSSAGEAGPADPVVEIWQAEHVGLFRFARAATADDQAAEDVLQEAFVRLIRELAAGRRPANAHAWLFRVATNLIVSQARRARTAERHLADLGADRLVASPEQHLLMWERDEAVRAAVTSLPVDARIAILLAAQGFSGREIATTLGRTEGATRTLLCRTRLKVRERLEAEAVPRRRAGRI